MIVGKQVILRKMEGSDTDDIVRWRNQEDVRKRFLYRQDFTRESHMNWIKTMVDTGKVAQMMICGKLPDGTAGGSIGSAYIRDIDREQQKGEYGLFIGEPMERGKRMGEEVTRLMLHYAFEELGLHKIYSRVLAENTVSLKSAERGGLRREGYCRDEVFLDGQYHDVVMLGTLNTDIL